MWTVAQVSRACGAATVLPLSLLVLVMPMQPVPVPVPVPAPVPVPVPVRVPLLATRTAASLPEPCARPHRLILWW